MPKPTPRMPIKGIFSLLCWEGAFAMAYEIWIGPTYLAGLAGELNVSVGLVSLMLAAPWIGSIGQWFGVWALDRFDTKSYTLAVASIARSLWVIPLLLALREPFAAHQWISVLAVVACISALFSSSSAAAWMGWVKDLIPGTFQGRFFGLRQRHVMVAQITASLLATAFMGWKPGGYRLGYAIIGVLALISAMISTLLLSKVPAATPQNPARVPTSALEPLRNPSFRKILLFGAIFHGSAQLAAPYFTYYLTRDLQFSMTWIGAFTVIANVGCFLFSGFWGHKIDRTTKPQKVIWITAHLIALSPLPYIINSAATLKWIAPFEYFVNGLAWSGYTLALIALLLRNCPEKRSSIYFSTYAAVAGITGAAANLLGGRLAEWLAPWGGFRALWLISASLRLGAIWMFFDLIDTTVSNSTRDRRGQS